MKKLISFFMEQSLFVNLLITYLVVQVFVLTAFPALYRQHLSEKDRILASINLWDVLAELDAYKKYDLQFKVLKSQNEIFFESSPVAVPLHHTSKEIADLISPESEFFFVVCEDDACLNKKSIIYLLPTGEFAVKLTSNLIELNHYFLNAFFGTSSVLNFEEFVGTIKIIVAVAHIMSTFKVFVIESSLILGSQLLGSAIILLLLSVSLITSTMIALTTYFYKKIPYPNIFTLSNMINLLVFVFAWLVAEIFSFRVSANYFYKTGIVALILGIVSVIAHDGNGK
ncbi:MAG: hypothetical protein NZT61_04270 [Deltaproteobacteria bacterium]|nr:hypothetical protein [Deltaproteobacteria bacterium]MCX7952462.1 hypothetical protein [Deltaproteobacteria bacterium]